MPPQTPLPPQRDTTTLFQPSLAPPSPPAAVFHVAHATPSPSRRQTAPPTSVSSQTAPVRSRVGAYGPPYAAAAAPAALLPDHLHYSPPQPPVADPSLLSVQSAASSSASHLEVRDVAELVRQLALSRYAARQMQQRVQELETSLLKAPVMESPQETAGRADTSVDVTAARGSTVGLNTSSSAAKAVEESCTSSQGPSPATQPTNAAAGQSTSRHLRVSNRASPTHRHRSPSSQRRIAAAEGRRRGASPSSLSASSSFPSKERGRASLSSLASLTSTSTFVLTSSARSSAHASFVESPRRALTRPLHSSRSQEARHRSATSRGNSTTPADRTAHRPARSSSHHHRHDRRTGTHTTRKVLRHQRDSTHGLRDDTRHRRTAKDALKAHRTKRTASKYPVRLHGRRRRHASPQRNPTSLDERRAAEQEAKELRRARRWQRRYYDLMSSYTEATAQRDAELADIHDLIEYMSWEQDRACHLRHADAPQVSAGAAAATIASRTTAAVSDGASSHTKARETRGTSPLLLQCSAPSLNESTSMAASSKTVEGAATSPPPPRSRPPTPAARTPARLVDRTVEAVSAERRSGRVTATPASPQSCNGEHGEVLSVQRDGAVPPSIAVVAAAADEAEALRREADAWRQRCLALLQQSIKTDQGVARSTAHQDSPVEEAAQLSYAAVPPPLPPRPQQRPSHNAELHVRCVGGDSPASLASSVMPQAAKEEAVERSPRGMGEERVVPRMPSSTWSQLHGTSSFVQPPRAAVHPILSTLSSQSVDACRLDFLPESSPHHRYAPPPSPPPSHAPPCTSRATLHDQRHAEVSRHASSTSPQRLPLFTTLPNYQPADRAWYSPLRRAAAATRDAEQPRQLRHDNERSVRGGGERGREMTPQSSAEGGQHEAGTWAGTAEDVASWQALGLPRPQSPPSTQPLSLYARELFQTAPPSSPPAAAAVVVAREQLERDIRRHDQLLAAIGKLQKTAAQHASRSRV